MTANDLTTSELLVLAGCARRAAERWEEMWRNEWDGTADRLDKYRANADWHYALRDKLESIVANRDLGLDDD